MSINHTSEEWTKEDQEASEPDFYGKWQPIETAPKDGTKILLFSDGRVESGQWEDKCEDEQDQMGCDAGWWTDSGWTVPGRSFGNPEYYSDAIDQPTHWMQMPTAPTGLGN